MSDHQPRKAWIIAGDILRECTATLLPKGEGRFLGVATCKLEFEDGTSREFREPEVFFDEHKGWQRLLNHLDSQMAEAQRELDKLSLLRAEALAKVRETRCGI